MRLRVFCDGSSGNNSRGPIGWAWIIVDDDNNEWLRGSGGQNIGSNNSAELLAAINGLQAILDNGYKYHKYDIELWSDSRYALRVAEGKVNIRKNHELAVRIQALTKQLNPKLCWIKGHSGNAHNETCDALAKQEKIKILQEIEPELANKKQRKTLRKLRQRAMIAKCTETQ